jgi:hypothetical protein
MAATESPKAMMMSMAMASERSAAAKGLFMESSREMQGHLTGFGARSSAPNSVQRTAFRKGAQEEGRREAGGRRQEGGSRVDAL